MLRMILFCVLCAGLAGQVCLAQDPQLQLSSVHLTDAMIGKAPEPPVVSPVRPSAPVPKPTAKNPWPKAFLFTSAGVYTAAILDMRNTRNDLNFCKGRPDYVCGENNPLARPFVGLPAPMYYASGLALATGVNYLSWKMARSQKLRSVWLLPQIAAMAANGWGYASSTRINSSN